MKGKCRRNLIWCSSCDANLVQIGMKCRNCGNREKTSKIKKPTKFKILSKEEVENERSKTLKYLL